MHAAGWHTCMQLDGTLANNRMAHLYSAGWCICVLPDGTLDRTKVMKDLMQSFENKVLLGKSQLFYVTDSTAVTILVAYAHGGPPREGPSPP